MTMIVKPARQQCFCPQGRRVDDAESAPEALLSLSLSLSLIIIIIIIMIIIIIIITIVIIVIIIIIMYMYIYIYIYICMFVLSLCFSSGGAGPLHDARPPRLRQPGPRAYIYIYI